MTPNPLISIIVAVLNGADTLEKCIQSVIYQSYPDKELIIMDGGSSDGTIAIIKKYDEQISYWESKPDQGLYHAWNKALHHANGEWISFIGSDDFLWDAYVLEHSIPYLISAKKRKIRVVYGKNAFISRRDGHIIEIHGKPWPQLKKQLKKGINIPHPGSFHHQTIFRLNGFFDENFKITADFEFLLRELLKNDAIFMPDHFVTGMHIGGLSANIDGFEDAVRESCMAFRKHHLPLSRLLITRLIQVKLVKLIRKLWGDKAVRLIADGYRLLIGRNRFFTET